MSERATAYTFPSTAEQQAQEYYAALMCDMAASGEVRHEVPLQAPTVVMVEKSALQGQYPRMTIANIPVRHGVPYKVSTAVMVEKSALQGQYPQMTIANIPVRYGVPYKAPTAVMVEKSALQEQYPPMTIANIPVQQSYTDPLGTMQPNLFARPEDGGWEMLNYTESRKKQSGKQPNQYTKRNNNCDARNDKNQSAQILNSQDRVEAQSAPVLISQEGMESQSAPVLNSQEGMESQSAPVLNSQEGMESQSAPVLNSQDGKQALSSVPLLSYVSPKHNTWEAMASANAKCDSCHENHINDVKNPSVLFRCKTCSRQTCIYCACDLVQDGKHELPTTLQWSPLRRSGRQVRQSVAPSSTHNLRQKSARTRNVTFTTMSKDEKGPHCGQGRQDNDDVSLLGLDSQAKSKETVKQEGDVKPKPPAKKRKLTKPAKTTQASNAKLKNPPKSQKTRSTKPLCSSDSSLSDDQDDIEDAPFKVDKRSLPKPAPKPRRSTRVNTPHTQKCKRVASLSPEKEEEKRPEPAKPNIFAHYLNGQLNTKEGSENILSSGNIALHILAEYIHEEAFDIWNTNDEVLALKRTDEAAARDLLKGSMILAGLKYGLQEQS